MENLFANAQIHEYSLRSYISIILLAACYLTFSQNNLSTDSKKAQKLYLKADKKYRERDFEAAIDLLQEATKTDHEFYEAYLRKGSLYNALGNEDSVYLNFNKYAKYASNPSASVIERLSYMAFDRGHYLESQDYLKVFLAKVPEKSADREIDLLKKSIEFALNQIQKTASMIQIEELPVEINRYGLQYLPAMTVDGNVIVYTKRDQFSSDEDIVISKRVNDNWQNAESISEKVNSKLNEGAATISADGRTMIFTACDRRDSYGSCDLYISRKVGSSWTKPKNLGNKVNSKYWESQPSLSADGTTLFFASNRPGGYGGRDLWVTQKVGDSWLEPNNLGSSVNSFKDETTPFIHFNGSVLYFSSNSFAGLGGFDLFSVKKNDSSWTKPENLGFPLNTYRDEVALLVSADGSKGFFAKELRKNREILDSKIVGFSIPEEIKPSESYYLSGKILDQTDKRPLKASLQIIDVSSNEMLYDNYSDSVSGEYYLVLPSGVELAGYVKKKGYLYKTLSFSTHLSFEFNVDTLNIELIPVQAGETLVLNNIYFDTDSYSLDSRSKSELENVIELLSENPNTSIEIGGHTDDIGDEQYNQSLSKKRALSVVNALLEKGVEAYRLEFKGYGDSKPLKPNDSEVNRQSNRRIEFRVLRSKH